MDISISMRHINKSSEYELHIYVMDIPLDHEMVVCPFFYTVLLLTRGRSG